MNVIKYSLTKRQRFLITSILLGLLIFFFPGFTNFPTSYQLINLAFLAVITYILTFWSLKEDVTGIEYVTLFTIPILFTIGTSCFLTILPDRKIFRYPLEILYPIAIHVILLTNNIFNVAAIRTIQLLRAARAVSYLMTLITTYFITTYISNQQLEMPIKLLLLSFAYVFITFQFFWSFDLGKGEGSKVKWYTLITTILLIELTTIIQLVPVNSALEGLLIITSLYSILGISTHHLERKLNSKIILEYILIASVILISIFATLPWNS